MSYFPDLSPYKYLGGDPDRDTEVVNVGWLDDAHAFEKGPVADEIRARLKQMCLFETARQTRGFHTCHFCSPPGLDPPPRLFGLEIVGGQRRLGSAEIRVKGVDKRVYAAPDLIYHYITEHSYQPPAEFLEAVQKSIASAP
jgi:hypothetical protein